jgi:hypothetical protein
MLDPSSELHLAEQGYESTALAELLGVPAGKVNDAAAVSCAGSAAAAQGGSGEASQATPR